MKYRHSFALAAAVITSGCTSTQLDAPELGKRQAEVGDLVAQAKCELDMAHSQISRFSFSGASIDLVLKVIDTESAIGNATVVIPVEPLALTLAANHGPSNKTTRTINFGINYQPQKTETCVGVGIDGSLGIVSWLDTMDALTVGTEFRKDISQVIL